MGIKNNENVNMNGIGTIIEIYDEEPILNVFAATVLQPEFVIYLGGDEMKFPENRSKIIRYFKKKAYSTQVSFMNVDTGTCSEIIKTLEYITSSFPDCAVNITGGSEIILFSVGMFCASKNIPVFTCDIRHTRIKNIYGCDKIAEKDCVIKLTVDDIITMTGGSRMPSNHADTKDADTITLEDAKTIWKIFFSNKSKWLSFTQMNQKFNKPKVNIIEAPYTPKQTIISELSKNGIIQNFKINNNIMTFKYKNQSIKKFVNDLGIWLELYIYKIAKESGYFDDVQISVMVDWNGIPREYNNTINEIDVVLTKNAIPIFISCKTNLLKTPMLNEISTLAELLGGEYAKPVIATVSNCKSARYTNYQRALDMGIYVIDMKELSDDKLLNRLIEIAES